MAHKLSERSFKSAPYANNRWSIVPDDGVAFDAVLQPLYWSNIARKLQPGDIIEVHAVDGTYYAELYVRSSSRVEATVVVLRKVDFDAAVEEKNDDGLFVRFRNHVSKWAVMREDDNQPIKTGFQTREQAEEWLRDKRRAA